MVTSLTETSNQTNKSFYTNVFVLLFITKKVKIIYSMIENKSLNNFIKLKIGTCLSGN